MVLIAGSLFQEVKVTHHVMNNEVTAQLTSMLNPQSHKTFLPNLIYLPPGSDAQELLTDSALRVSSNTHDAPEPPDWLRCP